LIASVLGSDGAEEPVLTEIGLGSSGLSAHSSAAVCFPAVKMAISREWRLTATASRRPLQAAFGNFYTYNIT